MNYYKLIIVNCCVFTIFIKLVYCASVLTNNDVNSETICNQAPEKYVQEYGIGSSFTLNLQPDSTHSSCQRLFVAPDYHGFFIRLHRKYEKYNYFNDMIRHRNKSIAFTCPLSIYSTNEEYAPPWRIDPCKMETVHEIEQPVRLLHGKIKIVWNHGGNIPMYQLAITVFGHGESCFQSGKHSCLKLGRQAIFCISSELVCDGNQDCPIGSGYTSDEDSDYCDSLNENGYMNDIKKSLNLWDRISSELLKRLFAEEKSSSERDAMEDTSVTIGYKDSDEVFINRKSNSKGLSRYGPWGYLLLGMVLCGAALLVCGLWECCCRRHKPTRATIVATISTSNPNLTENQPNIIESVPPSYEELDSPPSYSVLFPSNKTESIQEISRNSSIFANNSTTNIPL